MHQDNAGLISDIIDALKVTVSKLLEDPKISLENPFEGLHEPEAEEEGEEGEEDEGESEDKDKDSEGHNPKHTKKPKLTAEELHKRRIPRVMKSEIKIKTTKGLVFKLTKGLTVYVIPLEDDTKNGKFLLELERPHKVLHINAMAAKLVMGASEKKVVKPNARRSSYGHKSSKPKQPKHSKPAKSPGRKSPGNIRHARPTIKKPNTHSQHRHQSKPTVKKPVKHRTHAAEVPLFYPAAGDLLHVLGSPTKNEGIIKNVNGGRSTIYLRSKNITVNNADVPVVGASNTTPCVWIIESVSSLPVA